MPFSNAAEVLDALSQASSVTEMDGILKQANNLNIALTEADLTNLVHQQSVAVAEANTVLLYSGQLGDGKTDALDVAERIGSSHEGVATFGQTDASKLLDTKGFKKALSNVFDGMSEPEIQVQVKRVLYGESSFDGTRTTEGLFDITSERFVQGVLDDSPEGINVKTITPLAESRGVFVQTELSLILEHSNVDKINGVSRASTT